MPDETGTEATRSDAPSADESLFGDAADDAVAAVVEGEDSKAETEQDRQGSDDAGHEAGTLENLKREGWSSLPLPWGAHPCRYWSSPSPGKPQAVLDPSLSPAPFTASTRTW